MDTPGERLDAARHLWYSEHNAFRAQQALNGIIRDHPDSVEAEHAKALQDLIATSPGPGESFSDAEPDEPIGCRQAVFRTLAALLGTALIALLALWGVDAEPAWRAVSQGLLFLVFALIMLDFAASGEPRVMVWIGFIVARITAGWNRYLLVALTIGSLLLLDWIFAS